MSTPSIETELKSRALTDLKIELGHCRVMFAYDAARSIDLDEAERRIQETGRYRTVRHKRIAPAFLDYRPSPLRMSHESEPLQAGPFRTIPTVDILIYDFGAVAVYYSIPLPSSLESLLPLSTELYANEVLSSNSRKRVEDLLTLIESAATLPQISNLVEDYAIFHIEELSMPLDPSKFCERYGRQIAQILRAEKRPLSDAEVADVLSATMSYGPEDILIIDWNAALLIDREGEDVREVVQFANVELLEMRHLDQRLGCALDQSWETVSKRRSSLAHRLGRYGTGLRAIAELQVDNATLFEGVNNALKLLGDQYLARVYRMVSRRFHLDDWDAGILRKLGTLDSIYQKMSDQAAARRMEVLEWVVIILIAFSIFLQLLPFWLPYR